MARANFLRRYYATLLVETLLLFVVSIDRDIIELGEFRFDKIVDVTVDLVLQGARVF